MCRDRDREPLDDPGDDLYTLIGAALMSAAALLTVAILIWATR